MDVCYNQITQDGGVNPQGARCGSAGRRRYIHAHTDTHLLRGTGFQSDVRSSAASIAAPTDRPTHSRCRQGSQGKVFFFSFEIVSLLNRSCYERLLLRCVAVPARCMRHEQLEARRPPRCCGGVSNGRETCWPVACVYFIWRSIDISTFFLCL